MNPAFQPDGILDYPTRHGHHVSWFREREIEQAIIQSSEDDELVNIAPLGEGDRIGGSVFQAPAYDSEDNGFKPGSIRLLSHTVTANHNRPIYILIMGEWESGWSWFVPFSNYTAPATDWELLSELDPQPLKVLQVWNARSCPNHLLSHSWFITHVDLSLVDSARGLYRRMVSGDEAILDAISNRIGTKVFEANDPRLAYLKEEMEILDHLTDLALQHDDSGRLEDDQNVVPFTAAIPHKNAQLILAAAGDSPDRELAFHSWQVEGCEVQIHLVELLAVPDGFILRVEGDVSEILEEAVIYDGENSKLGLIQNGSAGSTENPLRFLTSSLRIELSDGQTVRLVMLKN